MMGTIEGNVRERLLEMFYGIYRKDSTAGARAWRSGVGCSRLCVELRVPVLVLSTSGSQTTD